ncbi:hypothetical protein EXIGLDRAFT_715808 [Exidia glandulosa HHB12029]|uniref:Uncharacterized protein n=1 Tax=Exidia glandulosa HHB12029 TaxID=1314781 RepID=A0A165QKG5_EXIGL|nr:hypothetical protein EXIGLDRAFT_715808 [Exidia glandulosa HHB12029]
MGLLSVMRFFALPLLVHLVALLVAGANVPTIVNLRIEGANHTIYEAPIITRGHNVTTQSAGNIHCDGTNHNENPTPGPTCTSALADAARLAGFTFDGTPFGEFDDIFIDRIGDTANTDTEFWGILLNFFFTPVGGCQQEVKAFDHVLWAFNAFSVAHFLKLDGPQLLHRGEHATFTVVDGLNNTNVPVAGASLGVGGLTDAAGRVTLAFETRGLHSLKATRADSLRSNRLDVLVV